MRGLIRRIAKGAVLSNSVLQSLTPGEPARSRADYLRAAHARTVESTRLTASR
jgi:hypothetical protein